MLFHLALVSPLVFPPKFSHCRSGVHFLISTDHVETSHWRLSEVPEEWGAKAFRVWLCERLRKAVSRPRVARRGILDVTVKCIVKR